MDFVVSGAVVVVVIASEKKKSTYDNDNGRDKNPTLSPPGRSF
jgi:hypothetical protein